jgi:hypothetical protein
MLKARFRLEDPDAQLATMTLTMPLKEWKELRDKLPSEWPAWQLSGAINDLVMQAQKVFCADHESR